MLAPFMRSGSVLLAVASTWLQVSHAQTLLPPDHDPFFTIPENIASYDNGAVLRSRSVSTVITSSSSISSIQLFYKTTGLNASYADGTAATVWIPQTPAVPPRILSYQFPEDSISLNCAASWSFTKSSNAPNNQAASTAIEGPTVVDWALRNGIYVVLPNQEGSRSSWLTGNIEGHATLDGIRAVINHEGLASSTEVTMYGYSGGAHSTVWAATLAESYAPELNIIAAAYGGTPVDLRTAYTFLNTELSAGLAGGALIGLANGHPDLNTYFEHVYTPFGRNTSALFRSEDYCLPSHALDNSFKNYSTMFDVDVFAPGTELSKVLAVESLLSNVGSITVPVPKFPRYQYHGNSDTTVPYAEEKEYVAQQCAEGANIAFDTYVGQDHIPTAFLGLPYALGFLGDAYNDTLPVVECGAPAPAFAFNSLQAVAILGEEAVRLIALALEL